MTSIVKRLNQKFPRRFENPLQEEMQSWNKHNYQEIDNDESDAIRTCLFTNEETVEKLLEVLNSYDIQYQCVKSRDESFGKIFLIFNTNEFYSNLAEWMNEKGWLPYLLTSKSDSFSKQNAQGDE